AVREPGSTRGQDGAPPPEPRRNPWKLLFGLQAPVDRRTYALVGFGLMLFKYAVDATAIHTFAHAIWTPLDYMSPLITVRQQKLGPDHAGLQLALALWTLPFMWIGLTMTIRRAYDAGFPAGAGLLYFVPVFNYLWMLSLCCAPSMAPRTRGTSNETRPIGSLYTRGLVAIVAALLVTSALLAYSVYALRSYGTALFIGAPALVGALSSYLYNRGEPRPVLEAVLLALLGIVVTGGALLLFAVEGAICIAMAAPIALVMAVLGALVGRALAVKRETVLSALVLPPLVLTSATWTEARFSEPTQHEVSTAIFVDAPPEVVWRNVTSFSDLPPPSWVLFELGLAYPVRATIEGHGVGAIRRCEFSTGAFVEPITVWDEPRRLAFDVVEQPLSMHELSPYADLHPPHLDGYFTSQRGEFRLIPGENGGTRLEGSTWYELRFAPDPYWRWWSDFFLHRIHARVLEHIRELSERAV
ncbi:MAG TPA: SRPBCC family protein, partial [Planctomycetota bacterium]|nr:SRPBCC family protein [Planctomycetota bacterium]